MKSICVALLVFMVCIGCSKSNTRIAEDLGFSSPSIVGEWHVGEAGGKTGVLTILSDGTGDWSEQGEQTLEIKWGRVKDKLEISFRGGEPRHMTLRENNTLAVKNSDGTLVVFRKKTDDR